MSQKVAIQGYAASFHDVAARKMLGDAIEVISCDTFGEVFEHVASGQADYGVVATENSNYGLIETTQQLMKRYAPKQVDTLTLPIEQCLLGVPGAKLTDIHNVYSHPVALVQCAAYLEMFLPDAQLHEHADTALSAADVAAWGDIQKASIASRAAAKLHGLTVLAESIETDPDNHTTFVLFQKA